MPEKGILIQLPALWTLPLPTTPFFSAIVLTSHNFKLPIGNHAQLGAYAVRISFDPQALLSVFIVIKFSLDKYGTALLMSLDKITNYLSIIKLCRFPQAYCWASLECPGTVIQPILPLPHAGCLSSCVSPIPAPTFPTLPTRHPGTHLWQAALFTLPLLLGTHFLVKFQQ